MGGKGKKVF